MIQKILAFTELRIAMLGVAMAKDTLDREHLECLLDSLEDAIHELKKELK